jgi:hypothetical protein
MKTLFIECRHIMPSGNRCHAAALRDKAYCYFHIKHHQVVEPRKRPGKPMSLPLLVDDASVQLALAMVLREIGSSRLEPARASVLLYGLKIAAQIAKRVANSRPRTVSSPSVTKTANSSDLKKSFPSPRSTVQTATVKEPAQTTSRPVREK